MEVADRVVVMNQGSIEQQGSPDEVYDAPASPFVLQFLGDVKPFHGRVGHTTMGDASNVSYPTAHQNLVNWHDAAGGQCRPAAVESALIALWRSGGATTNTRLRMKRAAIQSSAGSSLAACLALCLQRPDCGADRYRAHAGLTRQHATLACRHAGAAGAGARACGRGRHAGDEERRHCGRWGWGGGARRGRVWALSGRTVYAGFIDLASTLGVPAALKPAAPARPGFGLCCGTASAGGASPGDAPARGSRVGRTQRGGAR
jgi:hypothetical protein